MSRDDERDGSDASDLKHHGPLAPWRLSLAVLVAAVLTGPALWDSAFADRHDDFALLRSFGVFFLTWFCLGMINRTIVRAMRTPARRSSGSELADLTDRS